MTPSAVSYKLLQQQPLSRWRLIWHIRNPINQYIESRGVLQYSWFKGLRWINSLQWERALHLLLNTCRMPQSNPTTGPVRFLTPVRFLARKAEWSARRNFTPVLLSWSHQATGPVRLDKAVHLCFDQIILMIHMDPVRCLYGRRTSPARESQMFFISYGIRTGPVRDPRGCRTAPLRARKGIDTTIICKNPARASYAAVRGPHGLFTGCLSSLNPYEARKLIMHALKLYGPRTGGQNSYGAARDPHGPREWTYDFCSKQPGNNPGTTRTGPGSVMWLGHNENIQSKSTLHRD